MSDTEHRPAFETLARLLDDPSAPVHEALVAAFREQGAEVLARLRTVAGNPLDPLAKHAAAMLRELGDDDHIGAFIRYFHSGAAELETGCFLFEKILHEHLSIKDFEEPLDAMASRVRDLVSRDMSVRESCRVINRVMFHEWGYRGDQNVFLHPDGSLVGRVLESRRGIPISLCIIYLLVARRCGVKIDPIGLPGRFMLGSRTGEPDGFFIDCYDGGVFRSRAEVKLILLQNGLPSTDDFLVPVGTNEILCRCCRNLTSQLEAVRDPVNSEIFLGFVRELEKSTPTDDDSR